MQVPQQGPTRPASHALLRPTPNSNHPTPPPAGPKALLQWLGVVTWFPALAPPEDNKTAVAALYQQLAAKKLSRFREYAALFPEACFVLVGDNGQVRPAARGRRGAGGEAGRLGAWRGGDTTGLA